MQKCLVCSSKKLSTILDLGKTGLLLINFSQRMKLIVKKKNLLFKTLCM